MSLFRRVRAFWRGESLDQELRTEMSAHLEMAIEENLKRGMPAEDARRDAQLRFGGVTQAVEDHRESRSLPGLDLLLQDLRYTMRTLLRDRAFSAIAVLILALGIGANIAVFTVVNTMLLRPLPFAKSQDLVWLTNGNGKGGLSERTYMVGLMEDYQRLNHSFSALTSYNPFFGSSEYTMTGRGEPQAVTAVMVAENFFQTLGVEPSMGRLFTREECQKGGRPAVLLSYHFWQRRFASDPSIVGQAVTLSKQSVTVAGVLPPSFDFGSVFSPGSRFDVFVPAIMDEMRGWGNTLALVGRLKPGVSVTQAEAEGKTLLPQIKAAHPEWWGDWHAHMATLQDHVSGSLRRSLFVLWCAVGVILLIVCLNLSNLLMARGSARSKEFAMRRALGASRGRLIRQLLTESAVLTGAGALLGLGLAFAIIALLARQGSLALPLLSSLSVDGTAIAWTLLVGSAVAVLFGLAPALRISSGNLQASLKDMGHGTSAGKQHDGLRSVLVVSEVALACVLLIGAGLLLRSFLRVLDVDLGFQPSRAAVIKIDYDAGPGNNEIRRGVVLQELVRNVESIPGVESAGVTDMLPLGRNRTWGLQAKGRVYPKGVVIGALVYIVTPGYLPAMGMHLREGRDLEWRDTSTAEHVVIINQAAARRYFPDEDPVGRLASVNGNDFRVVGLIADVRESSVEEASGPAMYLPAMQAEPEGAELVVRTKLPTESLAPAVMNKLRSLNPQQPASEFRPLRTLVDSAVSPRRFFALLVTSFAGLGLILASLGIYGVISYTVTRRTQEIGIRMALGASAPRVQLDVIAKTLRLAFAGIAAGALASIAAGRWIASLLFGTEPTDPMTFAGIVILLAAVACLAGYIPARRASRIDPMIALRGS